MNKLTSMLLAATLSAGLTFGLTDTQFFKSDAIHTTQTAPTIVHRESWQETYTSNADLNMQFNVVITDTGIVQIDMVARNTHRLEYSSEAHTFGLIEYDDNYYDYCGFYNPSTNSATDLPIATILSYSNHSTCYELVQQGAFYTGQRVVITLNPKVSPKGSGTVIAFEHKIDVTKTDLFWSPYDVNTDGVVNMMDMLSLKKHMLGFSQNEDIPIYTESIVTTPESTVTTISEILTENDMKSALEHMFDSVITTTAMTTTVSETTDIDEFWKGAHLDPSTGLEIIGTFGDVTTTITTVSTENDPFAIHGDIDGLTVYDIAANTLVD